MSQILRSLPYTEEHRSATYSICHLKYSLHKGKLL